MTNFFELSIPKSDTLFTKFMEWAGQQGHGRKSEIIRICAKAGFRELYPDTYAKLTSEKAETEVETKEVI